MQPQVLIAGAGPTGLALALWLTKFGVPIRIVDKAASAGTTSRAVAVQARTLELYEQLGLGREMFERGHKAAGFNLWVRGEKAAHVALGELGQGLTRYPSMLIFPQDAHERLLEERLRAGGVAVERNTELVDFTQTAADVTARLRRADGTEETVNAAYLAGCDGARSRVRALTRASFLGGTYPHLFYVADVDAEGPAINGEINVDLDQADFLAIFPLDDKGRGRLIGTVKEEPAPGQSLDFSQVSDRAMQNLRLKVRTVRWFSTYHVHHRVADHFREGQRIFLLGDAAHIHSPVGGQGMNTGIGDAANLAWKLAAVLAGRADDALLDSFGSERIAFARRLVATTDAIFSFAANDGHLADIVRTRVAPLIVPAVMNMHAARGYVFQTMAQLTLNYRESPLSEGAAGHIHGGDRLPWTGPATDNFASLAKARWQAHIYGSAPGELRGWFAAHALPLMEFPWQEAHASAGFAQDALYLVRPDGYVGLACLTPNIALLESYLDRQRLRPE